MDPVADDAAATELWSTVHPLLAASSYLVLATAAADGRPWTTPLFFAVLDEDHLLWVSSPQSRHSQNLRVRPEGAITVFDSHAPIGQAEAVYLEASVCLLPHDELAVGCERLNDRLPVGQHLRPEDLRDAAPLRAYRADVNEFSVLVRGGDPRFTNTVDTRIVVAATPNRSLLQGFEQSVLSWGREPHPMVQLGLAPNRLRSNRW